MHCTDRGCQTSFARHHGIAAVPAGEGKMGSKLTPLATFLAKFLIALTFVVPVLLLLPAGCGKTIVARWKFHGPHV